MAQDLLVSAEVGCYHRFVHAQGLSLGPSYPGCARCWLCKVEPPSPSPSHSQAPTGQAEAARCCAGGLRSARHATWPLHLLKSNDTKMRTWCAKRCSHRSATPSVKLCMRSALLAACCWAVSSSTCLIFSPSDWCRRADISREVERAAAGWVQH